MSDFKLNNKTILITGATSGIGYNLVELVIKAGGKVIATGRNIMVLNELKAIYNKSIQCIQADLTKENELENLVQLCPKVDGFASCAGIVESKPLRYISREHLDKTFSVNLYAPILLISGLDRLKKINKNASFVLISSIASNFPRKGGTAYSTSKAGVEALTKVMAMEYAHRGIRANAIAPAMIETSMYENAKKLAGNEVMHEHIKKYPLGIGKPEDVGNMIVYLLSSASKWTTGTIITIDGGLLLGF